MPKLPEPATSHFALRGGLDLVTPAIEKAPGSVIAASNYEPHPTGYRRIDGFERYDGRTKPSQASYSVLNFTNGTAAISAGQTVTGATSGATGILLYDATVSTGTFGGGNAAGFLVLWKVSGTFQTGENLQVGGVTKAHASGTAVSRGASTDANDSTWLHAAIEAARTAIQAVPGSGRLRGVWAYNGVRYAVRDNVGATAGVLYKSTASGWTACDLGHILFFTAGQAAGIAEGDTLTGGTSGATATVKRIVVQTGTFAANNAAGYLVLYSVTGTFQNAEALKVSATTRATASGANAAQTLPAGGRYEFRNYNFYGASNLYRMYGVNGVGKAFEWDGAVFVPIVTGMATDAPTHLECHKNMLFLAYPGGSLQNSGVGDPYSWSPSLGASEIGISTDITALIGEYVDRLVIFGRNKISLLAGTSTSDFVLSPLAAESGAVEWSAQKIGAPYYFDTAGLRSLDTTQAYGSFRIGTVTQLIDPMLRSKVAAGVTVVASMRVRAKDQMRVFFSDGSGFTAYFGRKNKQGFPEILPFDLGKVLRCAASAEDSDGSEVLLFGSDDGYVYEMDAGTSFDGTAITAYLRTAFNHLNTPTRNKNWKKAQVEIDGSNSTALSVIANFGYSDSEQPEAGALAFNVSGGGGFWGEANWSEFYWSNPVEGIASARIDGSGANVSLTILSSATYETPHAVHGVTLHFTYRRLIR